MKEKQTLTGFLVFVTILIFSDAVFGEEVGALGIVPEDSFMVKLGTFLFILAVLMFLLQWRHKKRK